jgi:uncharacterized protein YdhG (YjbR/CyaY superfamily)
MNEAVTEYIGRVTDERRELLLKVRDLILGIYPDIREEISYGILKYSYSRDEWVFASYFKRGVTVHVGYKGDLQGFKARHPGFKTGRACVNLSGKQDIPWQDLEALIRSAVRP